MFDYYQCRTIYCVHISLRSRKDETHKDFANSCFTSYVILVIFLGMSYNCSVNFCLALIVIPDVGRREKLPSSSEMNIAFLYGKQ